MKVFISIFFIMAACLRLFAQAPNISYPGSHSYTVNTTITPATPVNSGGAIPPNDVGMVSTYAGNGTNGSVNGPIATATFAAPSGLRFDASGNLYVADRGNNKIRKITPSGQVSTLAGKGTWWHTDGPADVAEFANPTNVIVDNAGYVYVSDSNYGFIRKVSPDGNVTTIAGSNSTSSLIDGQGADASFYYPIGLEFDAAGNVYIADANNHAIRKMTPAGFVTTFAGNGNSATVDGLGTAASFRGPNGIARDASGNFYVTDVFANCIRKITPGGLVSTFAGTGQYLSADGDLTTASFNSPFGIAIDKAGNIYINDSGGYKVRKISPTGQVTTIAGTGAQGFNNGAGNVATFKYISGLTVNDKGNLFVADEGNNCIRKIDLTGYAIDKQLPEGLMFDSKTGIISGTPTVASPLTTYTITGQNLFGYSSTTVSINVAGTTSLIPSVINFPQITAGSTWDINFNFPLNITSNNNETPIILVSSNPAVATINADGTVHVLNVGSVFITATQAGNVNYAPAVPVTRAIDFGKDPQTITFPIISPKNICDADFNANATTTNPSIPIVYSSSNPAIATVSSTGLIHLTGVTGTVTITATQAEGNLHYAATPVSRQFTVSAANTLNVTITASQNNICTGTPVTFTATVAGNNQGLVYKWLVNGANAAGTSNTFTSNTLSSTDVVQCSVTTSDICPSSGISNTLSVNVSSPPVQPSISISANLIQVCKGTSVTFLATTANEGSAPVLQWMVNGIEAGTNSKFFQTADLQNGDVVTCTVANTSNCAPSLTATSAPITITVFDIPEPPPSVMITLTTTELYANGMVTFKAAAFNTGSIINYNWQLNGENAGTNNPTFFSNNFLTGDVVTCTVTTNLACVLPATSNAITLNLLPPENFRINNAFTPNGDGINDTWKIPELLSYPNCLVSIFDRNGGLILQSTGYSRAWDGTMNGKSLAPGVYYYVIDLRNGKAKRSGSVTILK